MIQGGHKKPKKDSEAEECQGSPMEHWYGLTSVQQAILPSLLSITSLKRAMKFNITLTETSIWYKKVEINFIY